MSGKMECRHITLGEDLFLDELREKDAIYEGYVPSFMVEVVAAQGVMDDWAAYVQRPNQIGSTQSGGAKLPQSVGERLFPSWATRYGLKWRD